MAPAAQAAPSFKWRARRIHERAGRKHCEYVDKRDRELHSHQPARQHQMQRKPDWIGRGHESTVVSNYEALRLVSSCVELGYRMPRQRANRSENLALSQEPSKI